MTDQALIQDEMEYTPETLRTLAKQIEDLRMCMLLSVDNAGSDPESVQFYLLALSALESAHRFMNLAAMKQSQGLAATRR